MLAFEGLSIDPNTREVLSGASPDAYGPEFDSCTTSPQSPGRVYTRDQLMEVVWGYAFSADTSTVTVHVRRLREKIEPNPPSPRYLQTVWGVGYRFGG